MRYSKYSAMASLVFIFIPFISAVITNFIPLPFSHKISFKVIMGLLFICAWLFLTWMVTSLPEETLQKIKLLRIDDTGTDIVKVTGELICVSVDMLRCSGICEDEKIAAKMLKKFKLTQQNIKQLIEYMHRMDDSDFAKEVLRKHNAVKIQQLSSSQFHPIASSNPVEENFGTSFGSEKLSKKGK